MRLLFGLMRFILLLSAFGVIQRSAVRHQKWAISYSAKTGDGVAICFWGVLTGRCVFNFTFW
jgi:hypothetical protein